MPSNRLIFVAHAATSATRRAAFAAGDEQLEPAALVAAGAMRGKIPSYTEALVSPALPARCTAEAFGLTAVACSALRDLDAGRWTNRTLLEIAPEDIASWLADPDYADHGGESLAALIDRLGDFLASKLGLRGTIIAVTHAAPMRAALASALGAAASAFWRIDVPPLAALVLTSDGRRWSLRGLSPLSWD